MTSDKGRPLHVVGARPNFMKAAPVVAASSELGLRPFLVHTGQHYDEALSDIFFRQLGLPEPDVDLGVGSGSHAVQTAALLTALETTMLDLEPSLVVVYGDVNSTLAATIVAAKLHIPVAHVEAGLRSFDRTMPEEVNRVVTDALASVLFVTSAEGVDHLAAEGIGPDGVHLVGNPMIDTLMRFRDRLDVGPIRKRLNLDGPIGVVTLHRPANVDDPVRAPAPRRTVERPSIRSAPPPSSKPSAKSRPPCRSCSRCTLAAARRWLQRGCRPLQGSTSSSRSATWISCPSLPTRRWSSPTRAASRKKRASSAYRASPCAPIPSGRSR